MLKHGRVQHARPNAAWEPDVILTEALGWHRRMKECLWASLW